MIKALLIQRIFSIPTDTLLIIFLKYSQELRDFCGFRVVPDASKFTRFKQDFLMDLQSMFDHLVDITEPICQRIDSNLASMSIFDTSGIEAWVTENNPKYANRIIKQLKAFAKAHNFDKNFDPYKLLTAQCLHTLLLTQLSNRCTSTDISAMPIKFGIVTKWFLVLFRGYLPFLTIKRISLKLAQFHKFTTLFRKENSEFYHE